MSGDPPRTYRESKAVEPFVGDPLAGIPVNEYVVEEVAREYDLRAEILARALLQVERSNDILDIGTLFAHSNALPVGTDDNGHLFVIAESEACWEVVAEEIGISDVGRRALIEAHDRHVRDKAIELPLDGGIGFIVVSFDFPPEAVLDAIQLYNKTTLTGRQATVEALNRYGFAVDGVAHTLGVTEPVAKTELAATEEVARRAAIERRTLDSPATSLSTLRPEPSAREWMGLDWSPWYDLCDRDHLLAVLPEDPGLYRVRHPDVPGLLYVGETGAQGGLRDRVGHGLAVGMAESTRPTGGNHDATASLWQIAEDSGVSPEVSVATPPVASAKRHRRSIEATLVAVCRRETGKSPDVMLNREPVEEELSGEGMVASALPESRSYKVPSWKRWRTVTSDNWLGLNWTHSRSLSNRTSVETHSTCAFRVWEPCEGGDCQQRLSQLGTTGTVRTRLFNLTNKYGSEANFSIAELPSLSSEDVARSRELEEVRYDLLGAHYLATGQSPTDQF